MFVFETSTIQIITKAVVEFISTYWFFLKNVSLAMSVGAGRYFILLHQNKEWNTLHKDKPITKKDTFSWVDLLVGVIGAVIAGYVCGEISFLIYPDASHIVAVLGGWVGTKLLDGLLDKAENLQNAVLEKKFGLPPGSLMKSKTDNNIPVEVSNETTQIKEDEQINE